MIECPQCHSMMADDARFCGNCAAPIAASAVVPSQRPAARRPRIHSASNKQIYEDTESGDFDIDVDAPTPGNPLAQADDIDASLAGGEMAFVIGTDSEDVTGDDDNYFANQFGAAGIEDGDVFVIGDTDVADIRQSGQRISKKSTGVGRAAVLLVVVAIVAACATYFVKIRHVADESAAETVATSDTDEADTNNGDVHEDPINAADNTESLETGIGGIRQADDVGIEAAANGVAADTGTGIGISDGSGTIGAATGTPEEPVNAPGELIPQVPPYAMPRLAVDRGIARALLGTAEARTRRGNIDEAAGMLNALSTSRGVLSAADDDLYIAMVDLNASHKSIMSRANRYSGDKSCADIRALKSELSGEAVTIRQKLDSMFQKCQSYMNRPPARL